MRRACVIYPLSALFAKGNFIFSAPRTFIRLLSERGDFGILTGNGVTPRFVHDNTKAQAMQVIPVNLQDRSYEIEIAPGALDRIGVALASLGNVSRVVLISDENVDKL